MNIATYLKMNYEELGIEIEKQNKKIKSAQEVIRLLKKLQIAESATSEQKQRQKTETMNPQNNHSFAAGNNTYGE